MLPLEKELETELLAIYEKCSTMGYRRTRFKKMLTTSNPRFYKGPVGTVRHLMFGEPGPTSGFRRLVKAGRLTWTVEWLIANNPRWQPLFQKPEWVVEKAKARVREAKASN
ncbi:MAG: hypothetical protein AAB403_10645 [Planctomycetota bacterium]